MNNGGDSMDWTPKNVLQESLRVCDEDEPDACVVLMLWNNEGNYDTKFIQSGMKLSEIISLMEVQKHKIIAMMTKVED